VSDVPGSFYNSYSIRSCLIPVPVYESEKKMRQEEMHERKRQQFEELLRLISDKNDQEIDPGRSGEADKNS